MYINDRGQQVFVGKEIQNLVPRVQFRRFLERRALHYKTTFQNLPISVENRRGSIRRGTGKDGEEWETKMKHPYGYIRGTEGVDGDHLDVFVGRNENAAFAYIVHCMDEEGEKFDEDKVMLGFNSAKQAEEVFKQHYDNDCFFGGIEKIPMWKFHDLAFVKKITTRKIKESREGVSLQVPQDMLERIHNFGKAEGGRDTDQEMRKSILGKNIMVNPNVREHGVLGMKWGSAGRHEEPTRIAARQHGFKDVVAPGILRKGGESVVTKKDGSWKHISLDHGTVTGTNHSDLHQFLSDHEKHDHSGELWSESREGGPGSGPRQHIEDAGMKYKGSQMPEHKGGIHSFEHPDHPGKTMSMRGDDIKSSKDVIAHAAAKGLRHFGDMHDVAKRGAKANEAKEHGVKGMKWGVRNPRKPAGEIKPSPTLKNPGKSTPSGSSVGSMAQNLATQPLTQDELDRGDRGFKQFSQGTILGHALSVDPKTLSMMQTDPRINSAIRSASQIINHVAGQGQEQGQHGHDIHAHILDALKELGWKVVEAGARLTGTEEMLGHVKSVLNSPAGKMLFSTDKEGHSKLTPMGRSRGRKHESRRNFESRMGAFLREAKAPRIYYARSIERYGRNAEAQDLATIREAHPDAKIDFPRTRNHRKLGMEYFHDKIDEADRVVIKASRGRKLTLGVFSEARHALKKGKPVYAIHKGRLRRVRQVEALSEGNKAGHFGKIIFKRRRRK